MYYEGAVEVLTDTIADDSIDVEVKIHCLTTIGNLGLDGKKIKVRKI
jgi:hypothetical protein